MKTRERKNQQLGLNASTASNRLKKQLLYKYVRKAGEHYCFRCGAEIESVDELSVEHKTPWLHSEDPFELFFNLENIAFSHLECNVGASKRKNKVK